MAGPHISPPSSPTQEIVAAERMMTAAPSGTFDPSVKDKGKSQVQDLGTGSEDLETFAAKHLNLVQNVLDPEYTRSLTTFMNTRKDKKIARRGRECSVSLRGDGFSAVGEFAVNGG